MQQANIFAVSLVAALGVATHTASAGTPAWCGSGKYDANSEELRTLNSSKDIHVIIPAIANALCTVNDDIDPHRGEIDAARQAWGKKLGMADADWADAAAWVRDTGHAFKADLSAKDPTKFTPIDQYEAIHNNFGDSYGHAADPLYATDMFDARLTDTGRMAFIDWCMNDDSVARADGNMAKWAVCWPDVDKFDPAKVYADLKTDTVHDGVARMWLRFHAYDLPDRIKEVVATKAGLIKKDDTWQKVFDTAVKARAEWTKTVGSNPKLLDLVLAMDAAAIFHSRKMFDGCEPKTAEALAAAVQTIPAKSFSGMHDDREMRTKGFAESAGPLLVNTPLVNVAAVAYSECNNKSATADYLQTYLQEVPGARGPRNYALGVVMGETFTFDDMNAGKMQYPPFNGRPYGRSGGAIMSAGGVVKSVKVEKTSLTVALEKTSMKQEDCVKEHNSNRLSRVRPDGSLEYELICDKWAIVTHDTTYSDFHMNLAQEKLLKPGVVFSSVYKDGIADAVAIWPNKAAKTPSIVLGGTIK